jgi:hypothetical protein
MYICDVKTGGIFHEINSRFVSTKQDAIKLYLPKLDVLKHEHEICFSIYSDTVLLRNSKGVYDTPKINKILMQHVMHCRDCSVYTVHQSPSFTIP